MANNNNYNIAILTSTSISLLCWGNHKNASFYSPFIVWYGHVISLRYTEGAWNDHIANTDWLTDKVENLSRFCLPHQKVSTQGSTKYFLSGIQSFSQRICLMKRGIVIIKKCDKKADIKWFCALYLFQLYPRWLILYLKWYLVLNIQCYIDDRTIGTKWKFVLLV